MPQNYNQSDHSLEHPHLLISRTLFYQKNLYRITSSSNLTYFCVICVSFMWHAYLQCASALCDTLIRNARQLYMTRLSAMCVSFIWHAYPQYASALYDTLTVIRLCSQLILRLSESIKSSSIFRISHIIFSGKNQPFFCKKCWINSNLNQFLEQIKISLCITYYTNLIHEYVLIQF